MNEIKRYGIQVMEQDFRGWTEFEAEHGRFVEFADHLADVAQARKEERAEQARRIAELEGKLKSVARAIKDVPAYLDEYCDAGDCMIYDAVATIRAALAADTQGTGEQGGKEGEKIESDNSARRTALRASRDMWLAAQRDLWLAVKEAAGKEGE